MVFNANFNNISAILVEETGENQRHETYTFTQEEEENKNVA
jgi:hypothetical protein